MMFSCIEVMMQNLISFNQLAFWSQTQRELESDTDNLMNAYFECLTECDDDTQTCKRVCRKILTT